MRLNYSRVLLIVLYTCFPFLCANSGPHIAIKSGTYAPADTHLKINCGGGKVSYGSVIFEADKYFTGDGKSYTNNVITSIKNTDRDALFRSERSTIKGKIGFGYAIPLPDGVYNIKLYFAEIFWGAMGGSSGGTGKRIFSVALEGQWLLSNYDINADVGSMAAVTKTYTVAVTDGVLNMEFLGSTDQPKISAFEVDYVGTTSQQSDLESNWQRLSDAPTNKIESQCIQANGKMYLISGFTFDYKIKDVNEIYDPVANTWSQGAPMPLSVTHGGFALINNEIWIISGFSGDSPGTATNRVQIYGIATNSWRDGPKLPDPFPAGAAAFYNGKLHYFGGLLPDRQTNTGNHYVLDINNQQAGWKKAAPLPNPRCHLSAAVVNGMIYAMGGQHGHDGKIEDQNTVEAYNPPTDKWTAKKSLPYRRSHFEPGTFVLNDQIVIVGGRDNLSYFYDRVTTYDPQADLWREMFKLPYRVVGPSAKYFNGKLIISNGGEYGDWNPTVKTWSTPFEVNPITLSVQNVPENHAMVSIYPNPVQERLHIVFTKGLTAQTTIRLTDISGKTILKKDFPSGIYNAENTLEMNGLSAGIYFLAVDQNEEKQVLKVIKR